MITLDTLKKRRKPTGIVYAVRSELGGRMGIQSRAGCGVLLFYPSG